MQELARLDPNMPVALGMNRNEVDEDIHPEIEFAYEDEDGMLYPYRQVNSRLIEVLVLGPHDVEE